MENSLHLNNFENYKPIPTCENYNIVNLYEVLCEENIAKLVLLLKNNPLDNIDIWYKLRSLNNELLLMFDNLIKNNQAEVIFVNPQHLAYCVDFLNINLAKNKDVVISNLKKTRQ